MIEEAALADPAGARVAICAAAPGATMATEIANSVAAGASFQPSVRTRGATARPEALGHTVTGLRGRTPAAGPTATEMPAELRRRRDHQTGRPHTRTAGWPSGSIRGACRC
jgi:hypothetical protein